MKEAEKKLIAAFETEKILLEKEEKKKYTKSLRFEFLLSSASQALDT